MNSDMTQIMGEFIGTLILVLLGDGVCAAVNLNKSKGTSFWLDCHRVWLGTRCNNGCLYFWIHGPSSFESCSLSSYER